MLEIGGYVAGLLFVSFAFVVFFGSPYVPTLSRDRKDVMKLYKFGPQDVFVDIGSGDGVLLRMAAKKGVKQAIGYELSPWLYLVSRLLSRKQSAVTTQLANFWFTTLPIDTTVVYTFLNARFMPRLKTKLLKHVARTQQPLYFISYGFQVPGLSPVKTQGAMYLYLFKPLQT